MIRAFVGIGSLAADPLPLETLERIWDRIAGGLSILFREGVPQAWNLEETFSLSVAPAPDLEPFAFEMRDYGYRLPWPLKLQYRLKPPSTEALVVLLAATEIALRGEEIRKCRWCEAFFVKTTSQRFCSRECTQAWVNSRRAGRKRKPPFVVPAKQQAEQQKVINRARKAGEQHRAGLEHDVAICRLCEAEKAESGSEQPSATGGGRG
jgi:hypothetical protein